MGMYAIVQKIEKMCGVDTAIKKSSLVPLVLQLVVLG